MAATDRPLVCPECGAKNPPGTRTCRDCGVDLGASAVTSKPPAPRGRTDEDDDRPRRRRRDADDDELDDRTRSVARPDDGDDPGAASLLVPIGVSGWAVAAGYLGLIGCIPCVGAPFAVAAIGCGILALTRGRSRGSIGKASGVMRAVVGIVCGLVGLLGSVAGLFFSAVR